MGRLEYFTGVISRMITIRFLLIFLEVRKLYLLIFLDHYTDSEPVIHHLNKILSNL